jgi:hypothetical protein
VRASAAVGWPAEFPSCWRRPGSSQVRLCLFFPQAEAHVHTAREEHDLHGPWTKVQDDNNYDFAIDHFISAVLSFYVRFEPFKSR